MQKWTLWRADKRKMDAFELQTWRRLFRIPRTARKTNAFVIIQIKLKHSGNFNHNKKIKICRIHNVHVTLGSEGAMLQPTAVDQEEEIAQVWQTKYKES